MGDIFAGLFNAVARDIHTNAKALHLSYDTLARDTESYAGSIVYFRGRVVQIMESGRSGKVDLRVYVDGGDAVYVHYEGPRLLEDDTVDIHGRVEGRMSYETIFGAKVTIPEVTALLVKRVE